MEDQKRQLEDFEQSLQNLNHNHQETKKSLIERLNELDSHYDTKILENTKRVEKCQSDFDKRIQETTLKIEKATEQQNGVPE